MNKLEKFFEGFTDGRYNGTIVTSVICSNPRTATRAVFKDPIVTRTYNGIRLERGDQRTDIDFRNVMNADTSLPNYISCEYEGSALRFGVCLL